MYIVIIMSFIWVYENENQPSYIKYSSSSDSTNSQKFASFIQVNNYIKQQINDFYAAFNGSTTPNDSSQINFPNIKTKTMVQRYTDISLMQMYLKIIMKKLLKNYYNYDYDDIKNKIADYTNYNQIINNGLDEINGSTSSMQYSQNVLLDSTIYSTILWVILAICIVYYIFIKL